MMSESVGLLSLFAASFAAATLLPGGSEAALYALLKFHPEWLAAALAAATVGNTLGGMTSYALGRLMPKTPTGKAVERVRRWGPLSLLLAWAPVVGDALCVAAGWLRLDPWASAAFMALGKFLRYLVIAQAAV